MAAGWRGRTAHAAHLGRVVGAPVIEHVGLQDGRLAAHKLAVLPVWGRPAAKGLVMRQAGAQARPGGGAEEGGGISAQGEAGSLSCNNVYMACVQ